MRYLLIIIWLFIYGPVSAQSDSKAVAAASEALNSALVKKDSVKLKQMLHDGLVYGHSNGWQESKQEMISDLFNGVLTYNKVTALSEPDIMIEGKTALLRVDTDIDVIYHDKPLQLKLHSLQVWVKEKKDWILMGRQSIKID